MLNGGMTNGCIIGNNGNAVFVSGLCAYSPGEILNMGDGIIWGFYK